MSLTPSIHSSKNALLIRLDQVQIEEIVEEKLSHFLKQRVGGQNLLRDFYEPSEQALVECVLEKLKGNQFKTAEALGINRNTLKKKIITYKLDIRRLLTGKQHSQYPPSRIFLSSADSMDLLSACRAKLSELRSQNKIPEENILKKICQPVERRIIQRVLDHCKGNQIRASRFLGINRNTLKKKMKPDHEVLVS